VSIGITRLTPHFAARIGGVDITRPIDNGTWAEIRAAFDEHSVLVFRGQPLDDDAQIAFSRRFGPSTSRAASIRRRARPSRASPTSTSRPARSSRPTIGG
jgi:alpha-ketoglutarate-dependent taurine dioxygenase